MSYKLFIESGLTNFDIEDDAKHSLIEGLKRIEKHYNPKIDLISYIFCTDAYLLEMNKNYLQHNTYTDVITFEYNKEPIEGEVYISIERVKENSLDYQVDFFDELKRVMAHGFLHLIGYNDKTAKDKEIMKQQENISIQLFS